ncbi:MAG: hypothetical protein ACLQL2_04165 [Methylovirgula sp.]
MGEELLTNFDRLNAEFEQRRKTKSNAPQSPQQAHFRFYSEKDVEATTRARAHRDMRGRGQTFRRLSLCAFVI